MQLFKRYVSPHELIVFAFEVVLISGSLMIAIQVAEPDESTGLFWRIMLAAGLCQLCLYYNDFYDLAVVHSGREVLVRLVQAAGAATILLGLLYVAVPSVAVHSSTFLRSLGILMIAVLGWRLLFNFIVEVSPLVENTLIIGTSESAQEVAHQLVAHHDFASRVVGFVDDAPITHSPLGPVRVIGGTKDIGRLIARHDIRRIVVGVPDRRGRLPLDELVHAKLSGVIVEDAATAYEHLTGKILLEELTPSGLIFSDGFRVSRTRRFVKRASDLVLSSVGLVVTAPLMALTALVVWVGSGRPILYRQARVGQHGRTLTLYKFRSMRLDAEAGGPAWASRHDDRVTGVGRFIRLTRLDELPQLWNVLRGTMSFVGPRPERPHFVGQLAEQIPFYHLRHTVKPGITGWAQVKYHYADSLESAMEKLRFDLYYIKHLSPTFDLTIVIDTVKIILFQRGSH